MPRHGRARATRASRKITSLRLWKTKLFSLFVPESIFNGAQGTCDQGVLCSFAHGEAELRRKGDPMPSIEYLRSLYTGAKIPDGEW